MKVKIITTLEDTSLRFTESLGTVGSVILHTLFFIGIFILYFFGVDIDKILLILTTAVSLEAIYLAIFIQMTINRNTKSLKEVEKDVDEIQEDVEEIEKDVDEIQKDVDEIQEDVEDIGEDVDEIQKDVDEIQEDEKEEKVLSDKMLQAHQSIEKLEVQLHDILKEIQNLRNKE
jgi:uncharacterized protein YoxC